MRGSFFTGAEMPGVVDGGTRYRKFRATSSRGTDARGGNDERFRAKSLQGETGASRGASAIHRTQGTGASGTTRIEANEVYWRDTPGVAGVEDDRLSRWSIRPRRPVGRIAAEGVGCRGGGLWAKARVMLIYHP